MHGNAIAKPAANVDLKVENNDYHNFDAKEMYNWIKRNKFVKLGEGASRKCYDMGNGNVIKVNYRDHDRFGDQCAKEARKWTNSSPEDKQYLAPMVEHGNSWVIMKKAEAIICNMQLGGFTNQVCKELGRALRAYDIHEGNVGYFGNGQFKVVDYAM